MTYNLTTQNEGYTGNIGFGKIRTEALFQLCNSIQLHIQLDYYAIYPPSGEALYGKGHQTAGLTAGRNGVVIWTRERGKPILTLAAPTPISGWSHVAIVYKEETPTIYVNCKLIQQGKAATSVMHSRLR